MRGLNLFKWSVSGALLCYLLFDAKRRDPQMFDTFWTHPKDWWLLSAASIVSLAAVMLTFVRWHLLLRALDIRITLRSTLRLGMIGYCCSLAPLGMLGGDGVKALLAGREDPKRRLAAVASVLVDRAVGVYALFLLASLGAVLVRPWDAPSRSVLAISIAMIGITVLASAGVAVFLRPGRVNSIFHRAVVRIPRIGGHMCSLLASAQMYRRQPRALAVTTTISVIVHLLFGVSLYLVARAMYDTVLPLFKYLAIAPISGTAVLVPLPFGPFEAVFEHLHANMMCSGGSLMGAGQGLLIAFGYRALTVGIAAIGGCAFLLSDRGSRLTEINSARLVPPASEAAQVSYKSVHSREEAGWSQ